jgi:hypothetical protein
MSDTLTTKKHHVTGAGWNLHMGRSRGVSCFSIPLSDRLVMQPLGGNPPAADKDTDSSQVRCNSESQPARAQRLWGVVLYADNFTADCVLAQVDC